MIKDKRIRLTITDSMVDEALQRSKRQEPRLKDRNYTNKSSKSKQFYRDLGFLGEIAFEKYLDSLNLYYSKEEDKLQELYGLHYDLGDIFCSKNGKALDIKTAVAHKVNDRLHYSKTTQDFRSVEYLVSLVAYPTSLTKTLNIRDVEYLEIAGSISNDSLNRNAEPATYYAKGYYFYENNKLTDINKLLNNFYTNDEFKKLTNINELIVDNALNYAEDNYIIQQLSVSEVQQYSQEYPILSKVSDRIKDSVESVYKDNVYSQRRNKVIPHKGREGIDPFYYVINIFNILAHKSCDVPMLVRTLMRFGVLAQKNNKRVYFNVYLDALSIDDIVNMMQITWYLPITYCITSEFAEYCLYSMVDE